MEFLKNIVSSTIGSIVGLLVAGTILIFVFVGALVGGIFGAIEEMDGATMEVYEGDANVISLHLNSAIVERGGAEAVAFNFGTFGADPQIGLDQIIEGLDRAAEDDNIKGLLLSIDGVAASPSTLEDIRGAILAFKESGKWVVSWNETMSQAAYYLNSAADEVYLQPNGSMTFQGLRAQSMFYTGMIEKLGMDVTVLRGPNNKYKSAVEPLIRDNFSDSNREQLEALLGDFWDNIRTDIAISRDLEPAEIDAIAEGMKIRLAEDAVEHGLVDALIYEDERDALLDEKVGDDAEVLSFAEYTIEERLFGKTLSDPEALTELIEEIEEISNEEIEIEENETDPIGGEIAVIYAVGGIESGRGDAQTIGSETIAAAIREARLASDVEAVVLRVNSPGGSALASDVIWRETILLKEAGKKFIVSMSDLAASGGYYISCAADKIYANPTTITGSIGVFGVIPNMGGAFEKHLGVSFDEVSTHSHAGKPDGMFAMNKFEQDAYNEVISDIYEDFTSKVAEGRGMTREQVEEVARGRVWSGVDALEIGLVDELGNLSDAVEYATSLVSTNDPEIVYLPEQLDPFEQLIQDFTGVEASLGALDIIGADSKTLREIASVHNMLESGEIYQARMPYSLIIE